MLELYAIGFNIVFFGICVAYLAVWGLTIWEFTKVYINDFDPECLKDSHGLKMMNPFFDLTTEPYFRFSEVLFLKGLAGFGIWMLGLFVCSFVWPAFIVGGGFYGLLYFLRDRKRESRLG